LVREKPGIERVIDAAHAHDAEPGFDVASGVPRERGDPVALPKTVPLQPLREPQRPCPYIGVGGSHDRSLDRSGDDFAMAVLQGRMVNDLVTEQRPLLHQTEHNASPPPTGSAIVPRRTPLSRGCPALDEQQLAAFPPPCGASFPARGRRNREGQPWTRR